QHQRGEREAKEHREEVDRHEHEHAEQKLDRTRAPDEDEQVIDEDGDDRDVEHVVPAAALTTQEIRELLPETVHRAYAVWSSRARRAARSLASASLPE